MEKQAPRSEEEMKAELHNVLVRMRETQLDRIVLFKMDVARCNRMISAPRKGWRRREERKGTYVRKTDRAYRRLADAERKVDEAKHYRDQIEKQIADLHGVKDFGELLAKDLKARVTMKAING